MGCFNQTSFLSNLQLRYGSPTVLIFLKKVPYAKSHATYSNSIYSPILLPVFGAYDDYGRIEDIVMDENVKFIEEFFGSNIETLIGAVDNVMVDRYNAKDGYKNFKNKKFLENVYFTLEHKDVFDYMVKYNNKTSTWFEDGSITEWFLNDLLGLERLSEKYDDRFSKTYKIPNNNDVVYLSDGGWGHFFDLKKRKEIQSFNHIDKDLWGTYHPKDFMRVMAYYMGSDDLYLKIKNHEYNSMSEHYFNMKLLQMGVIEDVLPFLRLGTYKGEYTGTLTGVTHSGGLDLNEIYPLSKLYSKELKQNTIDFHNFHSAMSANSLTYKLASYGNQSTDNSFYCGFYNTCLNTTQKEIELYEEEYED